MNKEPQESPFIAPHSSFIIPHSSFIVFAPNPWHDIWRNRQQIFSRLAARHRVLYVEPARASLSDWRRGRIHAADLRRPAVIEERPNLWLYRIPAWLPSRSTGGAFDRAADRLLAAHLRRTLRRLDFLPSSPNPLRFTPGLRSSFITHHSSFPILWLYRPTHWRWASSILLPPPLRFAPGLRSSFLLPPSTFLLVYHITDDYTAFGHLSAAERAALAQSERELLAAADLTIVTAPRLLDLKRPYARRIALVPNAVDYAAFQRALHTPNSSFIIHHSPLPHPILGYSGHVSSRLDLPLLRALALARPDWQLVFAGSVADAGCAEEMAALRALPNVHFLGVLPVEDVPAFVAACDVCLIPYRVDDETRAISSLKLYEYLAAGKPVISAAVPAAEEHADVVRIAEATVESWAREIEAALAEARDPGRIAARQAVAAANTWDTRVQQIEALLAELA